MGIPFTRYAKDFAAKAVDKAVQKLQAVWLDVAWPIIHNLAAYGDAPWSRLDHQHRLQLTLLFGRFRSRDSQGGLRSLPIRASTALLDRKMLRSPFSTPNHDDPGYSAEHRTV